jgi:cob(I)alamin adenosyltransferase
MKLYTTRGDTGQTDLLGDRVSKTDQRIDLLGTLDETTSAIGLGRAQVQTPGLADVLVQAQRDLYGIMAELAFTDATRPERYRFPAERTAWLETTTDRLGAAVTLPREFVVPGDTVSGAALDLARTIARRAERLAVGLDGISPAILSYLNRLSSLLFIAARTEDLRDNTAVRVAKASRDRSTTD